MIHPQSPISTTIRRISAAATAWLFVFLLLCGTTAAQLAGKGAVKGIITDTTGAAIPNATVTIVSDTRGTRTTSRTSGNGSYAELTLDPDVYTVTVAAQGFEKVVQKDVHVNALDIVDVNLKLPAGSSTETVTVTSEPPALETSNATLGATLEQSTYSELPIQQGAYGQDGARRATDFVALIPGVQFNETNGNATTNTGVVNGGGARGAVSDTYINGVPFVSAAGQGDPRFVWSAFGVDAVNQLQVQTVGYSAQYEGQGVQNYSIKQGTNTFHGAAFEYFRNTALDTYGFFDKLPNPLGQIVKRAEHQNEFGGYLGGPLKKDKLFFFGTYDKYTNSRGPRLAYQTNPTTAQINGNFTGVTQSDGVTPVNIYDPTSCPTGTTGNCQRTQFSSGGILNVIPAGKLSPQAQYLQKFLPPLTNQNQTNNYLGGYNTGLSNFTASGSFQYTLNQKQNLSIVFGIGGQQTTAQAAANFTNAGTAAFNQSPAPYVYTQQFNPKTKVGILDYTYTISPRMVNQFKFGFARYEGSTFSPGYSQQYSSAAAGITGLPVGQASGAFPFVRFSGVAAPANWANVTDSHQSTNAFTLVDNYNIAAGAHSLTFGIQMAWLQYNFLPQTGASTPLTLNFANSQTACYADTVTDPVTKKATTSTTACYAPAANHTPSPTPLALSGIPYASYLVGAVSSASFTTTTVAETGARFRPISLYGQDDFKLNSKLTLNIGLRWDYYPAFRETQNRLSFLDPNATNPITGTKGALAFAGNSASSGACNCQTNVQNWYKNFGPRIGLAYAIAPTTVVRASYGVIFAHGNGTGGSAISRQGTGLLGFAASPSYTSAGQGLPAFYINSNPGLGALANSSVPAYTPPPFLDSAFGTGYTTTVVPAGQPHAGSYTGNPQTVAFGDPYYGDRAPEFINWSFGIQQAMTNNITLTATYVGSQGHFLAPGSQTARGLAINQLDPKFLSLGTALSNKATAANLAAVGLALPYANYDQNQTIAKALVPFPQYNGITDSYGAVGNSNYHALQTSLARRFVNGTSFMVNYTWAKNIDDTGANAFRSGYAIPAFATSDGRAYAADRIERTLSEADRRHNLVISGVFMSPFGQSLFSSSKFAKAAFGGFRLSTIFMAFPGSPLVITTATCGTNPSLGSTSACFPNYNAAYTGATARKNGGFGDGITAASAPNVSFLDSNAFTRPSDYIFSTLPRAGAYGLRQPGNYNLDLGLRRSFAIPHAERYKLTLDGELFNVTNHVQFGGINTQFGSAGFGVVTTQANNSRDAQLSARIEF